MPLGEQPPLSQGSGGGSGRLWVRPTPSSSSSSSSAALRPKRCWMGGSHVDLAGRGATAWTPGTEHGATGRGAGRSSSPLNTAGLKAAGLAATSPARSER